MPLLRFTPSAVCLAIILVSAGCANLRSSARVSAGLKDGEIQLSDFSYVVIAESSSPNFIPEDVSRIFEDEGFEVIGRGDGKANGSDVLEVQYLEERTQFQGSDNGFVLALVVDAADSGKNLFTVRTSAINRGHATVWSPLLSELSRTLASYR